MTENFPCQAMVFGLYFLIGRKGLGFVCCLSQEMMTKGFPGGAVVKNLPANAGDTGSIPGPEKIPNAVEQLSP